MEYCPALHLIAKLNHKCYENESLDSCNAGFFFAGIFPSRNQDDYRYRYFC